jgi:iron complex outermembrane receptor protein
LANGVPGGGVVQANSQLRALTGGNANLDSESARTSSFGVAYNPAWAEGLSLELDWYKIRMEDVQVFQSTQAILNGCYLNPGAIGAAANATQRDQFCAAVARNAGGSIATVRPSNFNVNKGFVQGYDLQVGYTLPNTDYGIFSFQWDTSYAKDNTLFGAVGTYNGSPHWETRSNLTTRWQKDNWDATWAMRYYSDMEEACSGDNYFEYGITPNEVCTRAEVVGGVTTFVNDISSRLYHDVQLGWKTPWNGRIAAGARNVFGTEPPVARASFAHSFDAAYDLPGGAFYYLQYSHKF